MDTKKTATTSAIAISAALAGAGLQAQLSPALPTFAEPTMVRWLNDKPRRYALQIRGTAGAYQGAAEIVCEADGSQPKLNGRVAKDSDSAEICHALAALNSAVVPHVNSLATTLAAKIP